MRCMNVYITQTRGQLEKETQATAKLWIIRQSLTIIQMAAAAANGEVVLLHFCINFSDMVIVITFPQRARLI